MSDTDMYKMSHSDTVRNVQFTGHFFQFFQVDQRIYHKVRIEILHTLGQNLPIHRYFVNIH
jgi:hypothetical protein